MSIRSESLTNSLSESLNDLYVNYTTYDASIYRPVSPPPQQRSPTLVPANVNPFIYHRKVNSLNNIDSSLPRRIPPPISPAPMTPPLAISASFDRLPHANNSVDTLDSGLEYNQGPTATHASNVRNLPITHISSRLESLKIGDTVTRSMPESPTSEFESDIELNNPKRALTNSNLMLIDDDLEDDELTYTRGIINRRADDEEDEEFEEEGAAKLIKTETDIDGKSRVKIIKRTVSDFKFGKSLGEGSYSTVVLATDKHTSKKYAIKVLLKRHIIKEKKVKYINIEKNSLNRLGKRDGIIHLFFTFQDRESLYFVLDYAPNGELLALIKKYGTLNEECVRYYGAQMLDAIKYMHDNGLVHRDLKPENILISSDMKIQITDFGTAKLLEKNEEGNYPADTRAASFVGTAEYVSPELLDKKYCGKPSDIWAYGCIVYQMIAGKAPFKATNEYLTFQKITKLQYAFSAGFPMTVRDLIKSILVIQPNKRATIKQIQNHFFFQGINWKNHDEIWNTDPPEIGPYKMNAKAMMKHPDMAKTGSSNLVPQKRIHKKTDSPQPDTGAARFASNGESNSTSGNSSAVPTPLNPASAAAVALSRNPNDIIENKRAISSSNGDSTGSDDTEKPSTSSSSTTPKIPGSAKFQQHHSASPKVDLIPGTNIPRPTVNGRTPMSNDSRSNTRSLPKPEAPAPPAPMTGLDLAWARFLKGDERIAKIGDVNLNVSTTEAFEKKYRGSIIESPLGYNNTRRSSHWNFSTLRGESDGLKRTGTGISSGSGSSGSRDSSVGSMQDDRRAVTMYDSEDSKEDEREEKSSSSRFRKFLSAASINSKQSTIEKPKDRTLLVTTHGRALFFERRGDSYGVTAEIVTTYPFVGFKEVVSERRAIGSKLLPNTGTFAIVSTQTTFVCDCDKIELNSWTLALAKARSDRLDRLFPADVVEQVQHQKHPLKSPIVPPSHIFPGTKRSGDSNPPSPVLMESPEFISVPKVRKKATSQNHQHSGSSNSSGKNSKPSTPQQPTPLSPSNSNVRVSSEHKRESLMSQRMKAKPTPRKAPRPISHTQLSTSGLPSAKGNLLMAAQLAVSNSQQATDNRRSSFSKEEPVAGKRSSKITGMNSKLLARSHRKK